MLRFAAFALLIVSTAAVAETYTSIDDYLRKTSGLDPDSAQAACYSDAVAKSMGGMRSNVLSAIKGPSMRFPKATKLALETMLRRNWESHGATTLQGVIHLSCPTVSVKNDKPIEDLHPLAGLPE